MATQTWRPANQVASLAEQVHEMNAPPIEVRDLNKRYKTVLGRTVTSRLLSSTGSY